MTTNEQTADPPTPLIRGLRERVMVLEAGVATSEQTADPPTLLIRGLRQKTVSLEAIATKEQTADPPTPLKRGLRQGMIAPEAIAIRQYQLRELVTVYVDEMDLLAWAIACEQFANQLRDKAASFYGNSESY